MLLYLSVFLLIDRKDVKTKSKFEESCHVKLRLATQAALYTAEGGVKHVPQMLYYR